MTELTPVDHVRDGVYISGWYATQHADELRDAGITHVLKLYEDIPYFSDDFTTLENAIDDGVFVPASKLRHGVDFIVRQVDVGERVLVMCSAGISRSSTFVLAYMLERGTDLHAAYQLLRQEHPIAHPHPQMWLSLIMHYQLEYTLKDVWQWLQEQDS